MALVPRRQLPPLERYIPRNYIRRGAAYAGGVYQVANYANRITQGGLSRYIGHGAKHVGRYLWNRRSKRRLAKEEEKSYGPTPMDVEGHNYKSAQSMGAIPRRKQKFIGPRRPKKKRTLRKRLAQLEKVVRPMKQQCTHYKQRQFQALVAPSNQAAFLTFAIGHVEHLRKIATEADPVLFNPFAANQPAQNVPLVESTLAMGRKLFIDNLKETYYMRNNGDADSHITIYWATPRARALTRINAQAAADPQTLYSRLIVDLRHGDGDIITAANPHFAWGDVFPEMKKLYKIYKKTIILAPGQEVTYTLKCKNKIVWDPKYHTNVTTSGNFEGPNTKFITFRIQGRLGHDTGTVNTGFSTAHVDILRKQTCKTKLAPNFSMREVTYKNEGTAGSCPVNANVLGPKTFIADADTCPAELVEDDAISFNAGGPILAPPKE